MVGTMTQNPFRHPSLQTLVECHVLILIISLNSEVLTYLLNFYQIYNNSNENFDGILKLDLILDTDATMVIGQTVLPMHHMITLTV